MFAYQVDGRGNHPLIFRMGAVHDIDAFGVATLEGTIEHRRRRGGRVILTDVQPAVLRRFTSSGTISTLGHENLFEKLREAIQGVATSR